MAAERTVVAATVYGPRISDDRIVFFYYPILSCFWKMISDSNPNLVLGEILLTVTEKYPKCIFKNAQHNLLKTDHVRYRPVHNRPVHNRPRS